MNILQTSTNLLNISAYVYGLACLFYFIYIWSVDSKLERKLSEAAKWLVYLGFAVHATGLMMRWHEGGFSRPPWTNLYESLIAFAFGASLIQVFVITRWKVTIVGAFSVPVIATLMTMALLTPTKELEPLVPALQSGWLKIHVSFAILAYASFTTAACIAVLYLIRRGVSFSKIAALICWITVFNLMVAGGRDIYRQRGFYMARTVSRTLPDGKVVQARDTTQEYEGGPMVTKMEKVPFATVPYWLALASFLMAGFVLWFKRQPLVALPAGSDTDELTAAQAFQRGNDVSSWGRCALRTALGLFLLFLVLMTIGISESETITMASNPYLLFLMVMTCFFVGTFSMIHFRYQAFLLKLPSAARLNELSYVGVLFGFPFQTLLLITGAIWAYFAWGRSWGWDPKETWAFITWVAFLIYLHGKLLMKWKGPTLAVLTIIGFLILCFAFLGVNLVLSGLHSYGAA
jgi:ABC-type transport system involved in cytochrome c biogenesis permease subunit